MEEAATRKLIILGAGGFAREVAWLVGDINARGPAVYDLVGFWERDAGLVGEKLNGVPVLGADEVGRYLPDLWCVAGIGKPADRERAVREAEGLGCRFPILVHPDTRYDPETVTFGPGTVLCAGNILTVNITIGSHVHLNLDCTVGHDSVIEDFVTISPGCHLSGFTSVGRGAYMGTGSVTLEHHSIGAGAVVGAGAVITGEIPPGVTAVGVPARVLKK